MLVRVGMSWYLGVKPALTTLSEDAMHSIISGSSSSQSLAISNSGRIFGIFIPPLKYA